MANTITNSNIFKGTRQVVKYFTLSSDGTNETNTILYDSDLDAPSGATDTLDSSILEIQAFANVASTARVYLSWDATTKVVALGIPVTSGPWMTSFRKHGGLQNQGGAGKTGDILITTTGLASGDVITIVLTVRR